MECADTVKPLMRVQVLQAGRCSIASTAVPARGQGETCGGAPTTRRTGGGPSDHGEINGQNNQTKGDHPEPDNRQEPDKTRQNQRDPLGQCRSARSPTL